MKVKNIKFSGIEPVYNMTVEEHHNYLIHGGIVLKNCDALRYFAQLRTLSPETVDDDEEEYYDSRTSYEDAMCGGDAGVGYLMCG